jgi:hypothetical protein
LQCQLSKCRRLVRLGKSGALAVAETVIDMKQYLLSVCYPAGATPPPPDRLAKIMRDVAAVRREMQAAGVWVFSGGLQQPDAATVLRHENGKPIVTDGPFIETKEQIGGITILRAPDLETALEWAGKTARAITTPIEVRPFVDDCS